MPSMALGFIPVPLETGSTFSGEDQVCYNADGKAVAPGDTANLVYAGTAAAKTETGATVVNVFPPSEALGTRFQILSFANPADSNNGNDVYFTGPSTVAASGSNSVKAGKQVRVLVTGTSGKVLVDTLR